MWEYSDEVLEHFRSPRNVGYIEDPDGVGEVGSMACGDALRLMFKLDKEGRISEVKFQTFGCGSAIASSSALTEMIKGKTLEEAEKIKNSDIVEYLGGLPEQKMHCSVLGREALEAAIENCRTGVSGKRMISGEVVCHCFGVTDDKIKHAIEEEGLTTVDQVTHFTKAGGGCGSCKEEIAKIIAEITGSEVKEIGTDKVEAGLKAAPGQAGAKPMTNLQRIKLIQEIIENEIKPDLRLHGGDIQLVDVDGNRVVVSLLGTCKQCSISNITIKQLIEPKLHERVSEDLVVVEEK